MEVHTKLDKTKFAPLFGDWWPKIEPFFIRGGLDPIYAFLKTQSQKGKKIAPASNNTFRAFKETPLSELKAVIVCQDPYAKFIDGLPIASGVAMDCSMTARVQPTLQQFYNGIEKELYNGLNLNYISEYDLSYLSAQGVLLLNCALTVEKDKPGSHVAQWAPFTRFLFREIIGPTGVPVLFLGKEAGVYESLCLINPTYKLPHPVSATYSGKIWDTQGVFTKINQNVEESINDSILFLNIETPF
jgi:uracil DNA glycosylase